MADLPELTGSEKQIAWATSIRENALKAIEDKISETGLIFNEKQQAIYDCLRSQSGSSFWIDNRSKDDYAGGWLELAARMYQAR